MRNIDAPARAWLWLWTLLATIGVLLVLAGLLMAARHEPRPTSTTPSRLLEA